MSYQMGGFHSFLLTSENKNLVQGPFLPICSEEVLSNRFSGFFCVGFSVGGVDEFNEFPQRLDMTSSQTRRGLGWGEFLFWK